MAQSDRKLESVDSDRQHLGTVYAKALLAAAEKSGDTDAALSELDSLIDEVLDRLPALERTLSSPRVPEADKINMLDKAFAGKMTTVLINFLKVVVRHGRFDCLRTIGRAARRLHNESRGRVDVEVRAAEIETDLLETISNRLRSALGREVDLTTKVVPELIGGMIVRVGDTLYDGSVVNQLSRLRDKTLKKMEQQIRDSLERFEIAD